MINKKYIRPKKHKIIVEVSDKELKQIESNLLTLSKILDRKINRTKLIKDFLFKCKNLDYLYEIGFIQYDEHMQHMLFPDIKPHQKK